MILSFRQGIARYQTDILATPTFLQKSAGAGDFIDLIVSPDPTIIVFAQRSSNYIVEETKTVLHAWGPFAGTVTVYLFWDVNLLTGVLTRGSTLFSPIYAGLAPSNPISDQHWFDTTDTVMRVWNGVKWVEKIRVFAAYLSSGSIIKPYPLGSQAGINGDYEGGNIVLDSFNKPLRQSDGSFVTSVTSLLIANNSAKKVKFEAEVLAGMASEPIPKFSLVQMRAGRHIILARYTDYMSRIAGMVLEDLYTNEPGYITSEGLVRNEAWHFPESMVNRPIFCGANGEVTTAPPQSGVLQAAGFIYDTDSIYMNIFAPIILDDLDAVIIPALVPSPIPTVPPIVPTVPPSIPSSTSVPPSSPIVDFYASITSGTAPLAVDFLNASLGNPTGFEWDFTNDGIVDATTKTATYTYTLPGKYTVRLRALNAFGFSDEIKVDYIDVLPVVSPTSGFTNLGIMLGGPSQVLKGTVFQASITVDNDGHRAGTKVIRTLVIPDLKSEPIVLSGLPIGSVTTRDTGRTVITFPAIDLLPTGSTYGPIMFNVQAPSRTGTLVISATVQSPEIDSTISDNTTSISIEVKP